MFCFALLLTHLCSISIYLPCKLQLGGVCDHISFSVELQRGHPADQKQTRIDKRTTQALMDRVAEENDDLVIYYAKVREGL